MYRCFYFLLKSYLQIHFVKDLTFEEKCGFEIWLKDFNPFLGRFEILVKDLI